MNTTQLLADQLRRYPQMECRDLIKALYQAQWGCGHLIDDAQGAYEYLEREWDAIPADDSSPLMEPLGDRFVRVHIAAARARGLSRRTLFALFLRAAMIRPEDNGHFSRALHCIIPLAQALGRTVQDVETEVLGYERSGCPSVHHSDRFRRLYRPAYRVIDRETAQLLPVLIEIDRLKRERARAIVAIDGACASGKTTLASVLSEIYHAPVLHMDDFFLQPHQRTPERLAQPGGNVDWERFLGEALVPMREGKAFAFRPFSCSSQRMLEPVRVEACPLVFVEGSYSLHPALESHYDLKIVLGIDPALQRERLLRRNGEEMLRRFETLWIPLENHYFTETRIEARCDFRLLTEADGRHGVLRQARGSGCEGCVPDVI